jgi:TetR/AcrR family transcriptional regulator
MDTYHRLLHTALELFAEHGYDAVGVQQIAETAGTTKPPLYHHFGSKQGLLEALLAVNYDEWFARLEPATAYHGDLPLTIYTTAQAFFDFAGTHPVFYRLQHSLWFSAPESVPHRTVAPYLVRQHRVIETLFQQAARDHGNLRGHHSTYAITLPGMLNGYITSLAAVGRPVTEAMVHNAVRQFMYGIFAL